MRISACLSIFPLLLLFLFPVSTTAQLSPSSSNSSHPSSVPPGLKALEQARSQHSDQTDSSVGSSNQQDEVHRQDAPLQPAEELPSSNVSNSTRPATDQQPRSLPPLPTAICTQHVCHSLHTQLSDIIEGRPCRSVFINGKCPVQCAQMLSKFAQDEYWVECKQECASDITSGAAQRWQELCDVRMETLIDQGKEAVKSLVNDGLNWKIYRRGVLQLFLGAWILVGGIFYGIRRGRRTGGRLFKRRLLGRKNSDSNLPI